MFEIFHSGYYVASKFREKTQNRIVEYYEIELYTDSSGFTYLNGEKLRPKKHDVLIAKPNDVRRSEGGYSCHSLKFVCDSRYRRTVTNDFRADEYKLFGMRNSAGYLVSYLFSINKESVAVLFP